MVDIRAAHAFAFETFHQHGLDDWKIRWNRMSGTAGWTDHSAKTVKFSAVAVESWQWSEVENLVLHEMAHAIVGAGHEHDRVWKKKSRALGGDGEEFCPVFSTGPERFLTNAGTPQNTLFLVGVVATSWYAAPALAPFITVGAAILAGAGYIRNHRDPLPQVERESIEYHVRHP